jgi:transposase
LQRGLNNGQLAVGWLAYILSQADHRTSAVRDWANGIPRTLAHLLGHPIREVEFSDDRLGGVLSRLSDDETWNAIERDLWTATVTVYELELAGIRLESTTSYGDHHVIDEGVMQRGHSKDHRPDLPQLKWMAAAAEPSGHLIACDIHPGQYADDPLYTALIQRVRGIMGRRGLLDAGDCKMAALATRAEIAAHHDFSLVPLPLTGETATQVETWITAIVAGAQEATLGLQALLKVNLRLATTDYLSNGYDGLESGVTLLVLLPSTVASLSAYEATYSRTYCFYRCNRFWRPAVISSLSPLPKIFC